MTSAHSTYNFTEMGLMLFFTVHKNNQTYFKFSKLFFFYIKKCHWDLMLPLTFSKKYDFA